MQTPEPAAAAKPADSAATIALMCDEALATDPSGIAAAVRSTMTPPSIKLTLPPGPPKLQRQSTTYGPYTPPEWIKNQWASGAYEKAVRQPSLAKTSPTDTDEEAAIIAAYAQLERSQSIDETKDDVDIPSPPPTKRRGVEPTVSMGPDGVVGVDITGTDDESECTCDDVLTEDEKDVQGVITSSCGDGRGPWHKVGKGAKQLVWKCECEMRPWYNHALYRKQCGCGHIEYCEVCGDWVNNPMYSSPLDPDEDSE